MRWGSMHPRGPGFLFFWGRVGFWIFVVPIEFPSSFNWVLKCFQTFSQCLLTLSHMLCLNSPIVWLATLQKIMIGQLTWLHPKSYSSKTILAAKGGDYNIPNYFGTVQSLIIFFNDGTIKDAHHKRKKIELWGSPQLINESQFIPIIVTKISLEHEYILNCLLCHPRLNVMEWSHPYPLCLVHCQGCPNGLTWHLTQHNGLELDHSIVHNGIGTTSQGAVPLSTRGCTQFSIKWDVCQWSSTECN
jgi:hypothetical protein